MKIVTEYLDTIKANVRCNPVHRAEINDSCDAIERYTRRGCDPIALTAIRSAAALSGVVSKHAQVKRTLEAVTRRFDFYADLRLRQRESYFHNPVFQEAA